MLGVDLAINMSRLTALRRFCSSFSKSQFGTDRARRRSQRSPDYGETIVNTASLVSFTVGVSW